MKPKYGENFKFCYVNTNSFIAHKKTDNIYKDIAEGVDARTDTSYFELKRPLPEGKIKSNRNNER